MYESTFLYVKEYNAHMAKKKRSIGEAVAVGSALAGAALGAAAVILSDKKNQKKIKKTIDGISHDAVVLGKNIKKRAVEFKTTAKKNEKTVSKAAKPAVKKAVKKATTTTSTSTTKA